MGNFVRNKSWTLGRMVFILVGFFILLTGSQSHSVPGLLFLLDGGNSYCLDKRELNEELKNGQESPCPEGSAYHNETSKCYPLLERGPCGPLMVFYSLRGNPHYGDCGCMSNSDGCTPNLKEGVSNRMILAGPDRKQCYMAYSKGPCQSGEWYVLNPLTHSPECQKNPCCSFSKQIKSVSTSENPAFLTHLITKSDLFTFTHNGTCYRTFTQAFCKPGEYVQFHGTTDPNPECSMNGPPICLFGVGPQVGMPCDAGFKLVGDDCVMANVEFE